MLTNEGTEQTETECEKEPWIERETGQLDVSFYNLSYS